MTCPNVHSQYDDDDLLGVNMPRLRLIGDKRCEGPQTEQKGPFEEYHEELVITRPDALTDPFMILVRMRPHLNLCEHLHGQ